MSHAPLNIQVTPIKQKALCELLNKSKTPTENLFNALFEKIAHKPWSLLLDTSESKKSDGRYNIMVFDPYRVVEAKNGEVFVTELASKTSQKVSEAPFEATQKYLHSYIEGATLSTSITPTQDLPFIVGVAGMAGYDTGRFYEVLPSQALGGYVTPDYCVGLYLYSLIEDTHTGEFFYCSCDGSTFPTIFDEKDETETLDAFELTSSFSSNLTREQYTDRLTKIGAYLRAGDCYQVNMAQRFSATFKGNMWHAYSELRKQNQAPFSAYFCTPYGSVASISPERFIKVKSGCIETKPIKGTRPRFEDPLADQKSAESLLSAEKDRAENLMIVDLLRNDISKHCEPHTVKVPALFALESYQAVHHLVSTVKGKLRKDASPLTLLASAFPGGSITGAPKIRAMEVIDELEPHRRNIYCGSIFYMGFREDMDSSICIRTVLAENNVLYCWAGGGIVLDSDPADEYQETLDKVSKIIPVLSSLNSNLTEK